MALLLFFFFFNRMQVEVICVTSGQEHLIATENFSEFSSLAPTIMEAYVATEMQS